MSVYNLIVKSIKDGNVNLFSELLHNDYAMVSNQNNKEISKDNWIKNVSEMYQSIREGKMSFTGSKPAACIASIMTSQASSLLLRFGANPPSSPTPVAYPLDCKIFFRA